MVRRALAGAALALALSGCATLTQPGPGGTLTGKLIVQWAGENQFIYLPDPDDPLTFVTSDQRRIVPQRMYTDGGSVPPVFWALPGFSPWGYGPAYIVHDWLFEQHHCRYSGWTEVSFEDSARILGEVIDTLMRKGDVPPNPEARYLIKQGVRSGIARHLWDNGACKTPPAIASRRTAPSGPVLLRLDFSRQR
jgi:hypothetical protein